MDSGVLTYGGAHTRIAATGGGNLGAQNDFPTAESESSPRRADMHHAMRVGPRTSRAERADSTSPHRTGTMRRLTGRWCSGHSPPATPESRRAPQQRLPRRVRAAIALKPRRSHPGPGTGTALQDGVTNDCGDRDIPIASSHRHIQYRQCAPMRMKTHTCRTTGRPRRGSAPAGTPPSKPRPADRLGDRPVPHRGGRPPSRRTPTPGAPIRD